MSEAALRVVEGGHGQGKGAIGDSFSAFGLAPGYASLDFSHNGEDMTAQARIRIPFGGGE